MSEQAARLSKMKEAMNDANEKDRIDKAARQMAYHQEANEGLKANPDAPELVSTSGIGFAGLAAVKNEPAEIDASQIPVPTGYNILIELRRVDEAYESGILKSQKEIVNEESSTVTARVVDLGKDAYQDITKFPSGAWCAIGDWIVLPAYTGVRFKVHGLELFRLITDDAVIATVEDPSALTRI